MQNKSKLLCLVAASLVAGTAAASAQGYSWNSDPWYRGPAYETMQPRVQYYPGAAGPYGAINGSNHPAPSSRSAATRPRR